MKVPATAMTAIPNAFEPVRVLFVEDELLIREWVVESLTEQGFAVVDVATAAEALQTLATETIDILLTDINLPGGMDGAALAQRARELFPWLPVVYASARVSALDPKVRVAGSAFVPKPYSPDTVGRLLARVAVQKSASSLPRVRHADF